LRFIERQIDNISRGRADIAQNRFDTGWSSWRGKAIEPIVHDALTRLAATDTRLNGAETVSEVPQEKWTPGLRGLIGSGQA
jgi:hypothetical protein